MATINAEMAGTIDKVLVAVGDVISTGQAVAMMTSMKMQIEVNANTGGKVSAVNVAEGDFINEGQPVLVLE